VVVEAEGERSHQRARNAAETGCILTTLLKCLCESIIDYLLQITFTNFPKRAI